MKIYGPYYDPHKAKGQKPWFLVYYLPRMNADGTMVLDGTGKPARQRHRPYYETKDKAEADKDHIRDQHEAAGSDNFLLNREAATEYEKAKKIVGEKVSLGRVFKP